MTYELEVTHASLTDSTPPRVNCIAGTSLRGAWLLSAAEAIALINANKYVFYVMLPGRQAHGGIVGIVDRWINGPAHVGVHACVSEGIDFLTTFPDDFRINLLRSLPAPTHDQFNNGRFLLWDVR